MKIFACETSGGVCSVALLDGHGVILGEQTIYSKQRHTENILPMVHRLLEQCAVELSAIDVFAAAKGPGSFTGIRVGLSTVKAFASAYDKKAVGISTLEGISLGGILHTGLICALLDAGKNEYYAAIYSHTLCRSGNDFGQDRTLRFETKQWFKESIISPEVLGEILDEYYLKANIKVPILLIGEIPDLFKEAAFFKKESVQWAPCALSIPRATHIGLLALREILKGEDKNFCDINPSYLRLPEAQVNLGKKL